MKRWKIIILVFLIFNLSLCIINVFNPLFSLNFIIPGYWREKDPQKKHTLLLSYLASGGRTGKKGFTIDNGEAVFLTGNASVGKIRKVIQAADVGSFKAIETRQKSWLYYAADKSNAFLARDSAVIYITNANGATFTLLDDLGYFAKDDKHVYYLGAIIENADPHSFEIVKGNFSKDAKHAFHGTVILSVKDLATWKCYEEGNTSDPWESHGAGDFSLKMKENIYLSGWSGDKDAIYYGNKIIPEADPATFQVLSVGNPLLSHDKTIQYCKDYDTVFYLNEIMPIADAETFQMCDEEYHKRSKEAIASRATAHDKNNEYNGKNVLRSKLTPSDKRE